MSREKSGTRNYHWNVVGPQFNDLHTFFEAQYNALNTVVDDVAERARALDGNAIGTLAEFVERARLTEHPGQYPPAREMLTNLLADHETVIRQLRIDLETRANTYQDAGTNAFLTGLMERVLPASQLDIPDVIRGTRLPSRT